MSVCSDSLSRETFAAKFCRRFSVPIERFNDEVLVRTLYPHARLISLPGLGQLLDTDRSFVAHVGQLTRRRDFAGEALEFQHDPRNRGFWRKNARLRISIRRMQTLFESVWADR
jgi:hypothetical protein